MGSSIMAFDPSTARLYTEAPAAAQKPAGFDPTSARPAPATAAAPAQPGIFNRAVNAAAAKAATIGGALSDAADIVTAPNSTAPTPPPMPAAPSVAPPVAPATPSAPVAPAPGTGGIGSEFLQGLEAGAGGQNVSMLGGAMEAGGVLVEDAVPILGRALRSGGQKLQDYGTEVTPTPQVGSIADVPGDGVLDTLNRAGKFAAYSAGSGIGTSLPSLAIGGAAGLATANPMVGFIAGAIGPSYIQNLGDVYTSASNDPEITAAVQSGQVTEEQVAKTAALAAVPIAALDAIGLEKTLGAAFKPAKDALRQRIMRGIATGAISEGSTEGLQNIVSQWAQSTLGQHKDLSDRMIEVVDNVLGGVFAGGLMGGVAGIGDTPTAPRGATNKPGKEGEYIPPAPAGTPRLADPNRVIEASAAGQLIPVEGIVNRARAVEPTAPVAPALLTGENGPTTNIEVDEQPNITADAARRPREPLATEAGYTLTEALDEARRNAPPANNIDVQEGVDLTGVRGVEELELALPPDGIEVEELDGQPPTSSQPAAEQPLIESGTSDGKPKISEPIGDGVLADTKLFGNPSDTDALRAKGFQSLDRDRQHVMLAKVRTAINDDQVRRAIVESVPVDVMNVLIGSEGATKDALHDKAVLSHRLSVARNVPIPESVSRFIDALAASVKGAATGSVTEKTGLVDGANVANLSGDRPAATQADGVDQGHASNTTLSERAHEAATSPLNDLPEPSEAQKKSGNYRKGHVSFQGNDIAIENPIGSKRSGTDPNGKPWSVDMSAHYGYVKRTTGADGDQVDVYLPDQADESAPVHVFDQYNPDTGEFDEHKAVLGVATREEAERIYDAHFSDGTGPKRRHAVTTMSADEFKQWVREGDTKKPAREAASKDEAKPEVAAEPVASLYGDQAPDPRNSAPLQELDGYKVGDRVDVTSRTIGPSTVETLYTRQLAGFDEPSKVARVVNDAGKRIEVLTSELTRPPAEEQAETEEGERYPEEDAEDWDYEVANFPDPGATVNATKVAGPYISTDAAAATLASWKAEAKRIGREEDNSNKVIISLFDASGEISKPWKDAGYQVAQYDIKLGDDLLEFFPMGELMEMQEEGFEIVGVIAQPPCTCFSSSGARWWSERHDKHDRDMVEKMFGPNAARYFSKPKEYTRALVSLVDLAIGETNPKFWVVENPVGRIATEMGMPKPTLTFDPHVYGDPYTKRTQLWGKFNADLPTANVEPTQGSLMHKLWSRAEKDGGQRSLTPEGFAYALFMANHPTAAAKPAVSDNAAEQPATAGNSDAPLTVETYTDKSIIVRGDTRAHKDRIKAIGGALWNKKAGGWIFKASKRADVEKGLADLLGKSAEELPLSAPKNVPENPAPEPKRKQPGDADYTLLDARNDLIEYRTQIENQGAAVDDRLAERVRRQEKLVKEMEAAEKPTTDDDLSAMFDDVLAEELSARGQPAALPPAKRGDNIEVVPIGNNDEYILREPSARGDGSAQNLARFTFRNGRISKLKKLFEDSGSLDLIDIGIAQFLEQQRQAQPAKKPQTPQVAPLTGMAPLGARPPAAPQDRTAGESLTSAAKNTAQGLSSAIKGLGELFGGKGGRLNSGLSFDEETYAKAKPLFIQAVRNLKDAASDLREAMRTIIRMVLDQFGAETADGMKPYVVRFVGDVQAGAINLTEGSDDGIQDGLSGVDEAEQPEGVQPPVEDGGTGSAPAGEDGGSVSDAERASGGRASRGKRGTSGRKGGARSGKAGAGNADRVAAGNYRIEPGALEESRGPAQKARDNFRAIELARQIDAEGRPATLDEQRELALYVGWGGLSGVVPDGDGNYGKGFEVIGPKIRDLLSDIEYGTLRRSIQYAHYTSEPVIRAMWDAASQLGFKGGKVFEPGMGVGHFPGLMPADVAARTNYHGLELDHTTALIARLLYPEWGVRQDDFTKAPLPENMYDLVIGNPPFADIPITSDPKYATHGFFIHDYFFAKSLDAVRPGGLLMFISSAGTMNKNDTAARQYLADRADLVGAIRLPSSAFKANAGTEVTTDIIVMRKRMPGEEPAGQPFVDVTTVTLPDKFGNMKEGNISSYFAAHPEMVLGEQGFFDKLYAGRYGVRPLPGADINSQLSDAIGKLPSNVMTDWVDTHGHDDIDFASEERKEGSFYIDKDGRLMQHSEGIGRPVQKRGKGVEGGKSADELARIKGLIPVRDALRAVYTADLAGNTDNADRARERLNKAYDDYVKAFGPINKSDLSYRRPNRIQAESARSEAREEARYSGIVFDEGSFDPSRMLRDGATLAQIAKARADAREAALAAGEAWSEGTFDPADMPDIVIDKRPNIDPFADDPESYRLRAIERYNEATGEATKGLVFAESVITKEKKPEINSAGDAMLYVLNKRGYPDIDEIARAANLTRDDVLAQLGDSLFEVPGSPGTYETSDDYLSGNVRKKLAVAEAAALDDDRYRKNVQALLAVQPADLPPAMISATLGMPWLPAEDIMAFGTEELGLNGLEVSYLPKIAEWSVSGDKESAAATSTWGTVRVPAPVVLAHALNRVPIKVYDTGRNPDGSTWRQLNTTETEGALLKLQEVRDKFSSWVFGEEARADRLATLYNETYNNLRPWEGDGSYLTTPGVSSEWQWRPHQLRVIARILRMGNTYMGHAVGAGKTSAMIGAGMEMRRLGLAHKPMYVVPNHMLAQFAKEFYEQYPTAKIMVADERRFHTNRRKQFIADVASQDLDAVIITHSAFGKIPVSSEFQDAIIQEQIDNYREILDELGEKKGSDDSETRITRKRVENAIEKLEQRLSGRMKGGNKDQVFTFEEMGVDFLFVDEAHMFRKLDFATRMSGVKGISPEGSQQSMDLYVKSRYLRTQTPSHHMVLASGTPITNTMAELYSVSRYVQERELEERGLAAFDAWAAAFGDTVTEVEQDAAGGYKAQTHFAQFVNVPELSAMVRQVMDVVTSNDLVQYVMRPTIKGGKRQLMLAEKSDLLDQYQKTLATRMQIIENRKGPPKKGDDILLSVINDGRLAAIDMRLVDPTLGKSDPPSKLDMLVNDVYRTWEETATQPLHKPGPDGYPEKPTDYGPATQMIFANLGIGDGRSFNVAKYIVSELVSRGVPRAEVALISDFDTHVARQKLFNDMNEGKVRVLIGSTAKMATGVNAQRRLFRINNLDPLWYPADDEQRIGRGLRQGNMNPEIEVADYSTKGTYDSQMWNLMAKKARFIEGFFRGDPTLRTMEDLGESSQYEQAKAMTTNDPRLIELTNLKQDLQRAERRKDAFDSETYNAKRRVQRAEAIVDNSRKNIARIEGYIEKRIDTAGDNFFGQMGDTLHKDRAEFGKAMWDLRKELGDAKTIVKNKPVGEFGGFPLMAEVVSAREPMKHADGEFLRDSKDSIIFEDVYWANLYIKLDKDNEIYARGNGALALVNALEQGLADLEGRIERNRRDIADAEKDIREFTPRMAKTFDGQAAIDEVRTKLNDLEITLARESAAARAALNAQTAAADAQAAEGVPNEPPNPDIRYAARQSTGAPERGLSASGLHDYLVRTYGGQAIRNLLRTGKLKIVAANDPSLPQDAKDAMRDGRRIYGLYDEPSDTTFLVHDNLTDAGQRVGDLEDGAAIFLHELGVHYGMPDFLGQDHFNLIKKQLRLAAKANSSELGVAARAAYAQVPASTRIDHIDEEALAWLVTDRANHKLGLVKRILMKIRAWLVKHGFKNVTSPDELVELARGAVKHAAGERLNVARPKAQRFAQQSGPFYSKALQVIDSAPMTKATGEQWLAALKKGGTKQEEIDWLGLPELLYGRTGVARDDLAAHVRANQVEVQEVLKGGEGGRIAPGAYDEAYARYDDMDRDQLIELANSELGTDAEEMDLDADSNERHDIVHELAQNDLQKMHSEAERNATAYAVHQTPGGENYRELLLTLPHKGGPITETSFDYLNRQLRDRGYDEIGDEQRSALFGEKREAFDVLDDLESRVGINVSDARNDLMGGNPENSLYHSTHWQEANPLAHIRFNERIDADGKRVLFVEEIQSDWHQAGRKKGYYNPSKAWEVFDSTSGDVVATFATESEAMAEADRRGNPFDWDHGTGAHDARYSKVPNAPFKQSWPLLAMKRVIRWAAENGFDRVAWTTGDMQNERYSVGRVADMVGWSTRPTGARFVSVATKDGPGTMIVGSNGIVLAAKGAMSFLPRDKPLAEVVGAQIANRIMFERDGTIENEELRIGGDGMRGFYDKILPAETNKYIKKWGGKVGRTALFQENRWTIEYEDGSRLNEWMPKKEAESMAEDRGGKAVQVPAKTSVHSFDVTPEMRVDALKGQPLFAQRNATGNSGAFDGSNPSILYAARDPGQPVEDSPALEQSLIQRARQRFEPWLDAFRYEAQDKFHYLKKAQQEAADARELPELPESEDAYLAELRYHGMAGAAIEDFQRDHVDPMLKAIQDAGLDIGRVDEFLHARHAKEANAQLRKINPTADELEERIAEAAETGDFVLAARLANHKPYEGDNTALSGMSNAEAREVMAKARADGKFDALEDVGRRVDEITAARRNLLVASGLEKRGTIAAWENAYEHYVPLKREGKGDALPRRGRGYDTRGKEKRRAGSTRAVEHILANVVAQHEATLMRAEKAKVGRAMMTFAVKNPNPELYEVNKVDYQPSFDAQGLVTYRPEPGMVMADNVFVVRVRGEDHRITFNDANPDAMKIAAAMKNLGAEESGPIINALSKITRLLSLVNTGANPEFIISNFARDIQTAGYNLSGTDADALKWQIIGDVGKAWKGIRAFQKKQGGAWADKFDEFRKAGAQTGWLDHYRDINDREKALVAKVRDMEGGAWPTVKRGLRAIEKFIEDENTAVENAIRLSAFVHARDMGMTEAQAARLAKELTVNFNRRGAMGKTLNALYMFYNASIQGQVRIISAIAKSRKVQGLVVATVIGAALLDMWNRSVGDDDDDKPNPYDSEAMKYVKDRNLVFMLPGGDYVKIPLPWGYNVFHVLGQTMGEMMTKPGAKPTEAAARVAGSIVDAFNPIGGSVSLLQMISPTVVDPIAQWYENKDFAGRPLRPSGNPFGPAKPESQQYWSSVRPYSKWITEQLNTLTGGDEVRPGVVDFSPEAIDLAIDTITGGAGRFVADTVGAPWKRFAQGEKLETYEVPVLRKVYGSAGPAQITQDYYKHRDAVALTSSQLSHYKTDAVKLRDIRQKHAEELRMIPIMKATESQLKKLREMKKLTKDRARQREIEDRMRQVMARFNERYYKVVTRAAD